jgi:hypothetical protein
LTPSERKDLLERLRRTSQARENGGITRKKREVEARCGQGEFALATIADYVCGIPGLEFVKVITCPGCGHDRVKANGEPVLEAHHVASSLRLEAWMRGGEFHSVPTVIPWLIMDLSRFGN